MDVDRHETQLTKDLMIIANANSILSNRGGIQDSLEACLSMAGLGQGRVFSFYDSPQ